MFKILDAMEQLNDKNYANNWSGGIINSNYVRNYKMLSNSQKEWYFDD
jgi:hypothetical protein